MTKKNTTPKLTREEVFQAINNGRKAIESERKAKARARIEQYGLGATPREMAVKFIERQLDMDSSYTCRREKPRAVHYGRQELRELLDYIYQERPASDDQVIRGSSNL